MTAKKLRGFQTSAQAQLEALKSNQRPSKHVQWSRLGPIIGLLFLLLLSACAQRSVGPNLETLAGPTFDVYRDGSSTTYHADSPNRSYSGTLKLVVESAANYLTANGGGTLSFRAGDFDLGSDNFEFYNVTDVAFIGRGIDVTVIRNDSDKAADTEPFDCTTCDRLTIRDLTVSAGGALRSSSDALDFDGGDYMLIERVKVAKSRGRGIVFDGKGAAAIHQDTADHNTIRDCVIIGGVPSDGISLLASNNNRIEGCRITDVGGTGIYMAKASTSAKQPNKPSNDNVITGNQVENAGRNGIAVNSGSRNVISGNTVLNSSDDTSGLDGIRLMSYNGVVCDDNTIENNTASDNQSPRTQRYGLKITSANCHRTVVGENNFAGNLSGAIYDVGTDTIYSTTADTTAPSRPTRLRATAASAEQINLSWTASTDDVGVTGYEVFRNKSRIATIGDATTYSDTTVQASTTYSYQVRALDAAGNKSSLSTAASATTPAAPPTGATSLTFTPVADAYVKSDRSSSNYGGSSSLRADGSPIEHILLKFSVSGIGTGQVVKAVVRLYNTNSSGKGGDFYAVADNSWSETSVSWSSAPAASSTRITSLGRVSAGNWYEAEVTPTVAGDGLLSYKITSPSTDGAWYASKEGAAGLAPQLIVTVSQ